MPPQQDAPSGFGFKRPPDTEDECTSTDELVVLQFWVWASDRTFPCQKYTSMLRNFTHEFKEGHVVREEEITLHKIIVEKPDEKKSAGTPKRRWRDIKHS